MLEGLKIATIKELTEKWVVIQNRQRGKNLDEPIHLHYPLDQT